MLHYMRCQLLIIMEDVRDEREGKTRNVWAEHGRTGDSPCVWHVATQARMRKIAAVDRTVGPCCGSDRSVRCSFPTACGRVVECAGVGACVAVWGMGRVGSRGQRNQLTRGLELGGSRINFNRRDPLAGCATPVFARWNGSGLILYTTVRGTLW